MPEEPPNVGPDTEFADPERQQLLQLLEAQLREHSPDFVLPLDVWAAVWLADITKLRRLTEMPPHERLLVLGRSVRTEVLKLWNQRTRASSATSSPTSSSAPSVQASPRGSPSMKRRRLGSPSRTDDNVDISRTTSVTSHPRPKRSALEKALCRARDLNECVITKAGLVTEVAHIYPYSMASVSRGTTFWAMLRAYWSEEKIDRWENAIFSDKGREVCSNLMTLAPSVHKYWERALFALRPLSMSEDRKSLRVQFFWLKQCARTASLTASILPELPSNLDSPGENIKLYNCTLDSKIQSGEVIILQTDDPDNKPLPSQDLLEMQWVLHRLSALSGAAEALELEYRSDDESSEGSFDLGVDGELAPLEVDCFQVDPRDRQAPQLPSMTAPVH